MEKGKKSGLRKLGWFFSKSRSGDEYNGVTIETSQDSRRRLEDDVEEVMEMPSNELCSPKDLELPSSPAETKKKTFGSWRLKKSKRKTLDHISTFPPSPGLSEKSSRSYESPDSKDIQAYSMFASSQEETEGTSELPLPLEENKDHLQESVTQTHESRAQPAESPKKDSTKKPVLGKIGNLFNSTRKSKSKSISDSPTSPTNEKIGTTTRTTERKRSSGTAGTNEQNQENTASPSEAVLGNISCQFSEDGDSQCVSPSGNNGNFDNGLSNLQQVSENNPTGLKSKAYVSSTGSPVYASLDKSKSPLARPEKQSSGRTFSNLAVRRQSSSDSDSTKNSCRKHQSFLQESSVNKEESPRAQPKKNTKFSSRPTDSKPEKLVPAVDSEAPGAAKLSLGTASKNNVRDGERLQPHEATDDRNCLNETVNIVAAASYQASSEQENYPISQTENLNGHSESNCGSKALSFDIYLAKTTETSSPTQLQNFSSGETMEKSPNCRKANRKKRSLKSQSSQNDEKQIENTMPDEQNTDLAFNFEAVTENVTISESKGKPLPLSPDTTGPLAANQDVRAGANRKLSPKGESDKGKQQHPASSPMKKKKEKENQSGSIPASPTARKVQGSLFKNQPGTLAKAAEGNYSVLVSTTKAAYVEKASVPGSSAGSSGEDCMTVSCESAGAFTSQTAGTEDRRTLTDEEQSPLPLGSTTLSPSDFSIINLKASTDISKPTITSKLNIAPKPKNVELPIKSKLAGSTESLKDPTTGQAIHRGNTATKISLFENKKTSQKQIDFYATKSISQPKKYVERAKLNFGKKDSISANKQITELRSPDANKIEDIPKETKAKKGADQPDYGNNELDNKGKSENHMLDQMLKDESKNDLVTSKLSEASETECDGQLKYILEVGLISINAEEDTLSALPLDCSVHFNDNTAQLPNKANLDSGLEEKYNTGMGNFNTNTKAQANLEETVQKSSPFLENYSSPLLSENEIVFSELSAPQTEEVQENDNEEGKGVSKVLPPANSVQVNKKSTHLSENRKKSQETETVISVNSQNNVQICTEQSNSQKHNELADKKDIFKQTNQNTDDSKDSKLQPSSNDVHVSHQESFLNAELLDKTSHKQADIQTPVTENSLLGQDIVADGLCQEQDENQNISVVSETNNEILQTKTTDMPQDEHLSADLQKEANIPVLEIDRKSYEAISGDNGSQTVFTTGTPCKPQEQNASTDVEKYVSVLHSETGKKIYKDNSAIENNSQTSCASHMAHTVQEGNLSIDSHEESLLSVVHPQSTVNIYENNSEKFVTGNGRHINNILDTSHTQHEENESAVLQKETNAQILDPKLPENVREDDITVCGDNTIQINSTIDTAHTAQVENLSTVLQKETNFPVLHPLVTEEIHENVSHKSTVPNNDKYTSKTQETPHAPQEDNQSTVLQKEMNGVNLRPETTMESLPKLVKNEGDVCIHNGLDVTKEQEDITHEVTVLSLKDDDVVYEHIAFVHDNQLSQNVVNAEDARNQSSADSEKVDVITALHAANEKSVCEKKVDDSVSIYSQNGCVGGTESLSNAVLKYAVDSEEQFKKLQKSPERIVSCSVTSDDSILDSSSDMEQFAETIRKLESPITMPQKRKKARTPKPPSPYYGLPPIHEDFLEKILDSETFSFGLGRKEKSNNLAPLALFKLQSKETAEKLKPKRASTEQSLLLKSLRPTRETPSKPQETCDKENADVTDFEVKRSRIDSMYAGSKSTSVSRSEENIFSPTVTTVSSITTSFVTDKKDSSEKSTDFRTVDSLQTVQASEKESKWNNETNESLGLASEDKLHTDFSLLSFSDIMENNLQTSAAAELSYHSEVQLPAAINPSSSVVNVFPKAPPDNTLKSNRLNSDSSAKNVSDIFYFNGVAPDPILPNTGSMAFSGKGIEKINPRPGKIVIFSEANCEGTVYEIFTDVADCSSWELSPTIGIKTIRGCWILYEHPNFEGRSIALEEGDLELTNPWGEEPQSEENLPPTVIGSLRLVVKDYRVCQIDLFTEPDGLGIMASYLDDTEELQVYGKLQKTCSIKVHWGVWLVYEEPGFQGIPFIIEPGEYPNLSFWNTMEAYIGSLRPLKMGCRKVEIPYEPKIIIYEKPLFEGRQVELEKEVLKLKDLETEEAIKKQELAPFTTVGSLRVISGLWVGYEKPGFEGHQYLLEEGDYEEWSQWGGFDGLLQSLRPIVSDFSAPHMTMYSEKDLDEKAPNINVLGIISNMDETGYGEKTQSIHVRSGVWVAYETPDFTGEQYVLEKGMYSHFGAWGAKDFKISSVQPLVMDAVENSRGGFKVQLFSEPDFKGSTHIFEGDANSIEDSFTTKSCKVFSGRWVAYDKEDFSGNLCVLEEGNYPSLCAIGCQQETVIRSLQTINYEFSEPSIVLYGKQNFQGRKVKLSTETTNLQAMGYSPDLLSAEVPGGIWVLYEYSNYRGRQIILSPSKIADWRTFSEWNMIGSLRPLQQKRLYFKLRNKDSGMFLSTNGNLSDVKLLRIQVMEDTGAEDQIWVYHEGVIRCRIAEDCTFATTGSLINAGSKLGLTLEETGASMHWNISSDGRIYTNSKPNLVLDIKGGNQYDQQHVVLNPFTEGKLTQLWEVCIL